MKKNPQWVVFRMKHTKKKSWHQFWCLLMTSPSGFVWHASVVVWTLCFVHQRLLKMSNVKLPCMWETRSDAYLFNMSEKNSNSPFPHAQKPYSSQQKITVFTSMNLVYCTRTILTRCLYTFYSLFEVHLCTVTFGLMYG